MSLERSSSSRQTSGISGPEEKLRTGTEVVAMSFHKIGNVCKTDCSSQCDEIELSIIFPGCMYWSSIPISGTTDTAISEMGGKTISVLLKYAMLFRSPSEEDVGWTHDNACWQICISFEFVGDSLSNCNFCDLFFGFFLFDWFFESFLGSFVGFFAGFFFESFVRTERTFLRGSEIGDLNRCQDSCTGQRPERPVRVLRHCTPFAVMAEQALLWEVSCNFFVGKLSLGLASFEGMAIYSAVSLLVTVPRLIVASLVLCRERPVGVSLELAQWAVDTVKAAHKELLFVSQEKFIFNREIKSTEKKWEKTMMKLRYV